MSMNFNMTAKDLFNAKSSSKNVKDYIDVTLTATGCATVDKTNFETGEVTTVGYIATNDGVFGFTSNVLLGTMDDLCDFMSDTNEPISIVFRQNTSRSGKNFYTLEIL